MDDVLALSLLAQVQAWGKERDGLAQMGRSWGKGDGERLHELRADFYRQHLQAELDMRGLALEALAQLSRIAATITDAMARARAREVEEGWVEVNLSDLAHSILRAASPDQGSYIKLGEEEFQLRTRFNGYVWPGTYNDTWPVDGVSIGDAHAWILPLGLDSNSEAGAIYEHLRDLGMDQEQAQFTALDMAKPVMRGRIAARADSGRA